MIRPPPRSTLFPYTTLSRSLKRGGQRAHKGRARYSSDRSDERHTPVGPSSDGLTGGNQPRRFPGIPADFGGPRIGGPRPPGAPRSRPPPPPGPPRPRPPPRPNIRPLFPPFLSPKNPMKKKKD